MRGKGTSVSGSSESSPRGRLSDSSALGCARSGPEPWLPRSLAKSTPLARWRCGTVSFRRLCGVLSDLPLLPLRPNKSLHRTRLMRRGASRLAVVGRAVELRIR